MAKLISERDKIHDTSVYFVCPTVSSSGDLPAMCTITLMIDRHTHTHTHTSDEGIGIIHLLLFIKA